MFPRFDEKATFEVNSNVLTTTKFDYQQMGWLVSSGMLNEISNSSKQKNLFKIATLVFNEQII